MDGLGLARPNLWCMVITAMRLQLSKVLRFTSLAALVAPLFAQQLVAFAGPGSQATPPPGSATTAMKPEDTEVWEPVPKVVTPGASNTAPPSDAIMSVRWQESRRVGDE